MKKLILIICLLAAPVAFVTSCAAPSTRVQEVKTLKVVAVSVDATMKVAAQMYHDGKISAVTWTQIAVAHDRFQAAFNVAVKAVQSNLDSYASPDILTLAAQISSVLAPYLNKTSP